MGRVGGGITLIVVGAILTFALQVNIPGLGEYALGLILMLAGVLLLVLHYVTENQRRNAHTVVEERGPVVEERRPVVEERREVVREEPVDERRRRRI